MSAPDSPETGSGSDSALSVEDGAAAIENLLSSVPDDLDDDQDSASAEESANEGQKNEAKAEAEADEDDGLEFDDETDEQQSGGPEEPKYKNGQFAADDAKVVMDDGTTITVKELKLNGMFQRTFTEKTTALANEKKAFEQERSQITETKQQIEHQREVLLTLAQKLLPKEPQPVDPDEDPHGYILYLRARENYQKDMGELEQLWNARRQSEAEAQKEHEAKLAEQQRNWQEALKKENEALMEAIPAFKDKAAFEKFRSDAHDIGTSVYKLTKEEIDAVPDHRYIMVLRDAIAFRKAIAKRDSKLAKPAAQAPAGRQAPRIPPRQRMAPQSAEVRDRNTSIDRLRQTGSLQDAAKALEQFV